MNTNAPDPQLLRMMAILSNCITEEPMQPPPEDLGGSARRRQTVVPVNGYLANRAESERLADLAEQGLQELTVILLDGFGLPSLNDMEQFNHLPRDWLAMQLRALWSGEHDWCQYLRQLPNEAALWDVTEDTIPTYVVMASFGFVVYMQPDKEPLPIPMAYIQLLHNPSGANEFALVEVRKFDMSDSVVVPRDTFSQFGKKDF